MKTSFLETEGHSRKLPDKKPVHFSGEGLDTEVGMNNVEYQRVMGTHGLGQRN